MRKKIFLGIPCFDMVPPEILEDYMRFAYYLGRRYPEYDFYLGIKTKTEQFRARNELVKAALDVAADYLLMLDDDHIIDCDETQWATNKYEFLKTLIGHIESNPKIGLVGCLYYERGNECKPVLMRKITPVNYEWLNDDEILDRLQPVDVQGGGVMLLNMKVFDWIPGPGWFEPEHIYGTDVQICRKIQEAGFEVYSDTSIEIGHLRNQRLVVTGRNRHKVLTVQKDREDQFKAINNYGRMVKEYREDIKEFLGIDEKLASAMYLRYEDYWQPKFQEYQDKDQWYIDSSRDFLGRQVIVNNPEKPSQLYQMILDAINNESAWHGLDFACGTSVTGFEFLRRGNKMAFLDIPESKTFKFLQWRCQKYGLEGKATFLTSIDDLPSESFDYILALDCIEHFDEGTVERLMQRFSSLLKPDGLLLSNFMTNLAFDYPEHLFMDKKKFMQIIADNGLFPVNHFTLIKEFKYYGAP